jgi:Ca2+-binding EF-hand superfamily protein
MPEMSVFSLFDLNADGNITESEFISVKKIERIKGETRWLSQRIDEFNKADENKDGLIQPEEVDRSLK